MTLFFLSKIQSRVLCCINCQESFYNLWQFFSLLKTLWGSFCLFFMTVTLQKTRIEFYVALSNAVCPCFPMIRWRLWFCEEYYRSDAGPFSFLSLFFSCIMQDLSVQTNSQTVHSALGAWSPVHWTARELLGPFLCIIFNRMRVGWTAKKFEDSCDSLQ